MPVTVNDDGNPAKRLEFRNCLRQPASASASASIHIHVNGTTIYMSDMTRRQVVTNIRVPNSVWKKKVSDTLYELNIIPSSFSGKVVISFKDGGISYIEKTETLK